jgi:hypothetical protein
MVIKHKLLKNIRHNHIPFFVSSKMQYNLKIQGFGSVMLCCSKTSRVTTQLSITVSHPRILIFSANTSVRTTTSYGYKLIYIPKAFDVVNMPYIKITTKFNLHLHKYRSAIFFSNV